ncbi:MAG: polyprenyl synthetase family protein [Chloroflexota bacterium]|nr:polyprenyl synthetase family protein [Chloroflexota bacterium]
MPVQHSDHAADFDTGAAIEAVEAAMLVHLQMDSPALAPLYGMMRYHLGWATAEFAPERANGGKRLRPLVCMLCCAAAGGDPARAVSAAAAIELVHNFTLVHDDIQDISAYRRHRRTVWSIWGLAQGINVGDGMYAIAHQALLGLRDHGVSATVILDLMGGFDATVRRICEGQFLDIGFETRWDITAADYLAMIGGKTAAIFTYAARAGALLAGVDAARVGVFERFGTAIGLGFQVRDDLLGIWGDPAVTGKDAADDIRRRKKSLPIIMLHERADEGERHYLESLYAGAEVAPDEIATVIRMLDAAGVPDACQETVEGYHIHAAALLNESRAVGPAAASLGSLVERMAARNA